VRRRASRGRERVPIGQDSVTPGLGATDPGERSECLRCGTGAGIVISESTARIFGRGLQVGRLVDWHLKGQLIPLQVVGVVSDLRNMEPDRDPFPEQSAWPNAGAPRS
jgi:hypothetical protein